MEEGDSVIQLLVRLQRSQLCSGLTDSVYL